MSARFAHQQLAGPQVEGLRNRLLASGETPESIQNHDEMRGLMGAGEVLNEVARICSVQYTGQRLSWLHASALALVATNAAGEELVVKLTGKPNDLVCYEKPALDALSKRGVPVPKAHAEGLVQSRFGPIRYIALERLPGTQVSGFAHSSPLTFERARELVPVVAAMLPAVHMPFPPMLPRTSAVARMSGWLQGAIANLQNSEFASLVDLDPMTTASTLEAKGEHLFVHADLCGENLVARTGMPYANNTWIIDPWAAEGDPAFDVTRLVSRLATSCKGTIDQKQALHSAAIDAYGSRLDPYQLKGWTYVETVLEVGWNAQRLGMDNARELLTRARAEALDIHEYLGGEPPGSFACDWRS